jgi:hypothetical protein
VTENEGLVSVANTTVSALKASPTLLAVILLNAFMIGAAVWFLHDIANDVGERNKMILERCLSGGK